MILKLGHGFVIDKLVIKLIMQLKAKRSYFTENLASNRGNMKNIDGNICHFYFHWNVPTGIENKWGVTSI